MNYKKDFPIFNSQKDLVYLDSAATSQKPQMVLDAMQEYYTTYNSNVKRGLYPIAEKATAKVEEVRLKVAKFINAKHTEEIVFVRNTTEALNLIMNTWGDVGVEYAGEDTVLTTIMEHHSNFVPWQFLGLTKSAQFVVLDITEEGLLDLDEDKLINAKILAITHVSNVLGTINPIKQIIKKAKEINPQIIVIVDAAQSVPHFPIDVQELGCDFLAFSGHKTYASTGIGVLYGEKELLESMPPFLFGGEMINVVSIEKTTWADVPHKFEAGTPDIAGIVSLGAAIDYLNGVGMINVQKHNKNLMVYAHEQMEKIDGLTIYGPHDLEKRSGVIAFNIDGIHAHDIAQVLGDSGICIRAGHHCAMPLHKRLGITASARVSFGLYNDEEDINTFIVGLKKVKKLFFSRA